MRQTSALSCFEQDLDHFVNYLRSSYHFGPQNVVHKTSKEKKPPTRAKQFYDKPDQFA